MEANCLMAYLFSNNSMGMTTAACTVHRHQVREYRLKQRNFFNGKRNDKWKTSSALSSLCYYLHSYHVFTYYKYSNRQQQWLILKCMPKMSSRYTKYQNNVIIWIPSYYAHKNTIKICIDTPNYLLYSLYSCLLN